MGILCTIAQFQKYADQAPEITELSILVSSTSYKNKNVLTTVQKGSNTIGHKQKYSSYLKLFYRERKKFYMIVLYLQYKEIINIPSHTRSPLVLLVLQPFEKMSSQLHLSSAMTSFKGYIYIFSILSTTTTKAFSHWVLATWMCSIQNLNYDAIQCKKLHTISETQDATCSKSSSSLVLKVKKTLL